MGYNVMVWPPYSLDMNPIEHVWIELKKYISRYYPELISMGGSPETIKSKIADAAVHAWELLDEGILQNLVDSMNDRCIELIAAGGWYTHY
jgi:hypothetical protein